MKKDFKKVLASVVLGSVLICISAFLLMQYRFGTYNSIFAFAYWIVITTITAGNLAVFNNDLIKKHLKNEEILLVNEIKNNFIPQYVFYIIFYNIVWIICMVVAGGIGNFVKSLSEHREFLNPIVFTIIVVIYFVILQYKNAEWFFKKCFKKKN